MLLGSDWGMCPAMCVIADACKDFRQMFCTTLFPVPDRPKAAHRATYKYIIARAAARPNPTPHFEPFLVRNKAPNAPANSPHHTPRSPPSSVKLQRLPSPSNLPSSHDSSKL